MAQGDFGKAVAQAIKTVGARTSALSSPITPAGAAIASAADATTQRAVLGLGTSLMTQAAQRADTWDRAWRPPAAQNMPAVSVATYSAPTASQSLVTALRVGGVDTGSVDMAGDTHFRYDGTPSLDPHPAINTYATPPLLPGGSAQAAYYAYSIETVTDAAQLDFQVRPSTTSLICRVFVDGQPTQDLSYVFTGLVAGNGCFLRIVFPTTGLRTVKVAFGDQPPAFKGVVALTAATLARPTAPIRKRIAILGDSYEGGSGSAPDGGNRLETAGFRAAVMLGADSIWHFGVGGTGYVTAPIFGDRVSAIVAAAPSVVIVSGSINDGQNDAAAIRAGVDAVLAGFAGIPEVYVTGPSLNSSYAGNSGAIRDRTIAAGRVFIDALAEPWLDVTKHIRSDGVHPNAAGHKRRASRLHEGILQAITP